MCVWGGGGGGGEGERERERERKRETERERWEVGEYLGKGPWMLCCTNLIVSILRDCESFLSHLKFLE